jgi:putative addiction module antidote
MRKPCRVARGDLPGPEILSEAVFSVYTDGYTERAGPMIETKIRKVGNSAVMTLTTEMLTILDAKEGDTLFVVRGDDGSLRVLAHDPALADALAAAEIVMDENRNLLQDLA